MMGWSSALTTSRLQLQSWYMSCCLNVLGYWIVKLYNDLNVTALHTLCYVVQYMTGLAVLGPWMYSLWNAGMDCEVFLDKCQRQTFLSCSFLIKASAWMWHHRLVEFKCFKCIFPRLHFLTQQIIFYILHNATVFKAYREIRTSMNMNSVKGCGYAILFTL